MPRRMPRLAWLALPLAYFLYFFGITASGVIGPDEPRYASIGREMASTGDWITPRLWGAPWFEKPALLYWMTGTAFRAGLSPDLAPRLPVALLAVAFLALFCWALWREFGCFIALAATFILATSAGWCFYSQIGVTDIPLSATFSAAMLLAMPWISQRDKRLLPVAGLFLGFAVLAKGPVALVLAAPLALRWRNPLDWLHPRASLPFLAVAAPWYILCYAANGTIFIADFFLKHNIGRFISPELQHGQPWWFYLPVLAILFLPWTPLLAFAAQPIRGRDPRVLYLLLWAVWPIVFFSLAVNKLPGYILPAFPAIAALVAVGLSGARRAAPWLAFSALLTTAFAITAPLVDIGGISRTAHLAFRVAWLFPIPFAAAAYLLDSRGKRLAAVACVACASTAGIVYLKLEMGQKTFARELWRQVAPHASETCVQRLGRDWRYGLNYYSVTPLPDCTLEQRRFEIRQVGNNPPSIAPSPPRH